MRNILLLLWPFFVFGAKSEVIKYQFHQDIYINLEFDLDRFIIESSTKVNGKKLKCLCGNDPRMVVVVCNTSHGYCGKHMPKMCLPEFNMPTDQLKV